MNYLFIKIVIINVNIEKFKSEGLFFFCKKKVKLYIMNNFIWL